MPINYQEIYTQIKQVGLGAKERKKNPALFVLARDGESALWRDFIPKIPHFPPPPQFFT